MPEWGSPLCRLSKPFGVPLAPGRGIGWCKVGTEPKTCVSPAGRGSDEPPCLPTCPFPPGLPDGNEGESEI